MTASALDGPAGASNSRRLGVLGVKSHDPYRHTSCLRADAHIPSTTGRHKHTDSAPLITFYSPFASAILLIIPIHTHATTSLAASSC
jgi:hypothetical protein